MINSRLKYSLIIGLLVGLALAIPTLSSSLFDDAYIHARIAKNIVSHGLPIFNNGDYIKVGSSTGFVLFVAIISLLNEQISAIRFIEFCTVVITVVSLVYLIFLEKKNRLYKLLVSVGMMPLFLVAAYGGMETPILCMLLIFSVIAYKKNQDGLVIFFMAIATWFRFEAIVLLFFAMVFFFHINKKALLFSFPFFILVLFDSFFYGSMIPHAGKVKSIAYGYPLVDSIKAGLSFGGGAFKIFPGVAFLGFFFTRAVLIARKAVSFSFADLFLLFAATVFVAWCLGRSGIFPWYYCIVFFSFGLYLNLSAVDFSTRKNKINSVLGLVGVLLTYVAAFSVKLSVVDPSSLRVNTYLNIGGALYKNCPTCTLLTSEIGGLGYSFEGKVFDGFGLVSADAVKFHPMRVPEERQGYGIGAIPTGYAASVRPDYIVSMPVFTYALRKSEFIKNYIKYDCPFDSAGGLNIFGDAVVEVYSRSPLGVDVLNSMGCK